MYKVRFNLGRGARYMTWKVENLEDKTSKTFQPEEVTLTLIKCTLINHKKSANKIFSGSNKSVCAWVLCDKVLISSPEEIKGTHIRYNPKLMPYWNENGKNVDGKKYEVLKTNNKNIIYE